MAQIREFTVEGLAGRSEPISVALNSDVNVFFGLNGSGKTTLLKILHSALSTDVDILKELPFTRATEGILEPLQTRVCSHIHSARANL